MKSVKKIIPSKLFQSKTSVPIEEQENQTCENCDHEFKGKFCPNCGQKVDEFNRPIGYILHFYLSHSFAFDNRTFKTLTHFAAFPFKNKKNEPKIKFFCAKEGNFERTGFIIV